MTQAHTETEQWEDAAPTLAAGAPESDEAADADAEASEEAAETGAEHIDADPLRILEALLFAASAPLSTNAIRERMPAGADVGGLLMELQKNYEGRGIHLVEMEGTWAFRTATDLSGALQISREVKRKLSRAAMETLAIVAYHQPVTRAEVESIRGVATHKGTLDVLIEAGWVKPGRRRETPGRPLTWVTTASFLDQFGLEAITDLPGMDELKASGLLDRRPAIETLGGTGDLFGDDLGDEGGADEDSEYDHLAPEGEEASVAPAEDSAEEDEAEYKEAGPDEDAASDEGEI